LVTRRALLKGLVALGAGGFAFAGYAFGVEPRWRLRVQRYNLAPHGWPAGLKLRASVIADVHAGEPAMPLSRIHEIVRLANTLEPDVHLLLGDFQASHRWQTRRVHAPEWSAALAGLKAPLGVHAVLGNHDWWDDHAAQRAQKGPIVGRIELERHGVRVYENDAVRLEKGGRAFWLAGLGDQIALFENQGPRGVIPAAHTASSSLMGAPGRRVFGVDDLPGTMARIKDDAPVILLAHEPDIFPKVPARVALTISGHTHGGQVRLFGYSPIVPSAFGNRFAYGHVVEDGRHLVVSGGLGCSILPVRFGVPPEIVLLDIGAA
jgi:hypothetical protein